MRLSQKCLTQHNSTRVCNKLRICCFCSVIAVAVGGSAIAAAQTPPAPAAAPAPPQTVPVDALQPALVEVTVAVRRIQIEHWKVPREWKDQFSGDATSIEQDVSGTLPGLFQAAHQSPAALEPEFAVMHNVDALYEVLVRVTIAANLAGGKADAATLDNALDRLESACKSTEAQLLQSASLQDQQIVNYQSQLRAAKSTAAAGSANNKTIVVDNRVTSHKTTHHKSGSATAKGAPGTPTPQTHPNTGP